VAIGKLSVNNLASNAIENSFILQYNILPWLRFRETLSFTYMNQKRNWFLPYNAVGADWLDPHKNESRERNLNSSKIMTRSQLFITPRINSRHVFSTVLMWETDNQQMERSDLLNSRGPSVHISDPSANTLLRNIISYGEEVKSLGALVSVNYVMMDKYIGQFNLRADGSSKFGEAQRWGYFPSASVAWRFSAENFMRNFRSLSEGKLRFSYGQSGKQPSGAYVRHAIYNTQFPYQYMETPLIRPLQVQLSKLRWQTVSSVNIGLDLGFFNERLNLTFELYDKITSDLLWERSDSYQIPSSSGYSVLNAFNAGKVRNRGWEWFMNVTVFNKPNFNLNLVFDNCRFSPITNQR
jgi:hypothetical protein